LGKLARKRVRGTRFLLPYHPAPLKPPLTVKKPLVAANPLRLNTPFVILAAGGEVLKLRIEVFDGLPEDEVIIRCGRVDEKVQTLQAFIQGLSAPQLIFYKGGREFYFPPERIFFFETEGETVYAHTADDAFKVKYRLYELEPLLPRAFVRVSKGTIVNTSRIYAITRNLAASSKIEFANTHKHVYASRHYFQSLKHKMNERSV
jgi:hypothetical protein